jgi:hypothetical protein
MDAKNYKHGKVTNFGCMYDVLNVMGICTGGHYA